MRVHIWCPRFSESALAMRDSLRAKGIRVNKSRANSSAGYYGRFINRVRRGDLWINWGPLVDYAITRAILENRGVTVLNNAPGINKRDQLLKLQRAGVPCLEVSTARPIVGGWLGRSLNHQGGYDLLHNTGHAYWTKKLDFIRELRIHIYKGKSIHAGLKVPRTADPHPWIRSYDSGWKVDYSRAADIADSRRSLAKKAIEALGLDFGAVDIGVIKGSKAVVIEVNTAPGVEGESLEAYVQQFMQEVENIEN